MRISDWSSDVCSSDLQFEINLEHVDDLVQAADDCILFKRIVQGVAQKHGFQATFMAKPYLDRAGSGMHMHVSLLDAHGRNVFDGGADIASATLRHAIGGALERSEEHTSELQSLMRNSYAVL